MIFIFVFREAAPVLFGKGSPVTQQEQVQQQEGQETYGEEYLGQDQKAKVSRGATGPETSGLSGDASLGNLASELSDVHEGFRERLAGVFGAWRARLTQALGEAQRTGDLDPGCRPETIAHFLVASLEGAILLTKVSKDIRVMEQCVGELKRYLALYERTARAAGEACR